MSASSWAWRCRVWRAPTLDWHRLLEVCALFGTLIADLDGLYDPALYNDRLLLGLKGTMSEAELHLLKQRLYQGCLSKARRGALTFALPSGYVWDADGAIQFDPDEQVQTWSTSSQEWKARTTTFGWGCGCARGRIAQLAGAMSGIRRVGRESCGLVVCAHCGVRLVHSSSPRSPYSLHV